MAHIQADAPSPISTGVQNTDDKKKGLLVEDDNVVDDLCAVFFRPRHVVLSLNLLDAKGLADPPRVEHIGFYCVVLGVSPLGDEMPTPLVVGQPDPVWDMLCYLPLKDHPWDGDSSLRVEVIRVDQDYRADPGTSNGFAVVGRAEIPLPSRVREMKTGPFELFSLEGAEGKVRGNVNLEMQLLPFEDFDVNF